MTDNFRDFVAVVTGAAGGVGSAVSSWLLAQGARVFDLRSTSARAARR